MFSPDVIKLVLPVPVDSSSIDEYIVSGGYNTSLRKKQIKFLKSCKKKIIKDFYEHSKSWDPKNKSYVYKLEPIFSIDGELISHHYVGSSKDDKNLFGGSGRFRIHFKNMINRTEGKEVEDSPSFEKSKDHFEKCKLVSLVVYIEPVTWYEHGDREDELIAAHVSEYGWAFIENKLSSSGEPSEWSQAQTDKQSREMKGNSCARGHSRLGEGKGRVKSLEEKAKISETTREFYESRQFKVTYKNGIEEKIHSSDCKEKLGVATRHVNKKAERMTPEHPKYDENYKMGPKQKGPRSSVYHKLWNKGIVKVEFDDEWGSLKEPFYLEHKDTGEITFYESITDGLKKIRCYDGEPIAKKVLQKIVRGHIHGDDVEYFPYTLFIKDKD